MGMVGLRDLFVVAPAASHHHHHQHQDSASFDPHCSVNGSNVATALGVGVFPLLATAPCLAPAGMGGGVDDEALNFNRSRSSGIQLWQGQQSMPSNYLKKPMLTDSATNFLDSGNFGVCSGGGGIVGSGSTTGLTCQDCGNQAKKDCSHRRCRTCCKSRGYDCPTHVKSTWVPAARRRERQLMVAAAAAAGSSGSTSSAKKPRLIASQTTTNSHTSTSNNTPPRSFDTSSSHQETCFKEQLPSQVREPAVFKCVRVTSVDDGDDEFAYQATVKIRGHVFKGLLYDQGEDTRNEFPNISELHLGGTRNGASSSSPVLDPSDVYAASGGGFLGGSGYGNPIN